MHQFGSIKNQKKTFFYPEDLNNKVFWTPQQKFPVSSRHVKKCLIVLWNQVLFCPKNLANIRFALVLSWHFLESRKSFCEVGLFFSKSVEYPRNPKLWFWFLFKCSRTQKKASGWSHEAKTPKISRNCGSKSGRMRERHTFLGARVDWRVVITPA